VSNSPVASPVALSLAKRQLTARSGHWQAAFGQEQPVRVMASTAEQLRRRGSLSDYTGKIFPAVRVPTPADAADSHAAAL